MKRHYFKLAGRERLLLLCFLSLVAILWSWGGVARGSRLLQRLGSHRAEVATQELWLGKRAQIEALSKQAAQHLQPELTLDATRLFSEVNRLAQGLNYDVGGQRTEQSGRIAIHLVQLNLRKVDMAALLRFYAELQKRAPYLGIEQCELGSDRSEAGRLTAVFRIYAIQVVPDAVPKT